MASRYSIRFVAGAKGGTRALWRLISERNEEEQTPAAIEWNQALEKSVLAASGLHGNNGTQGIVIAEPCIKNVIDNSHVSDHDLLIRGVQFIFN